jgi:hypothetical protein
MGTIRLDIKAVAQSDLSFPFESFYFPSENSHFPVKSFYFSSKASAFAPQRLLLSLQKLLLSLSKLLLSALKASAFAWKAPAFASQKVSVILDKAFAFPCSSSSLAIEKLLLLRILIQNGDCLLKWCGCLVTFLIQLSRILGHPS